MFEKADTDRDGFVSGAEIKGIFLKSGLAQPVLARIWYERLSCLLNLLVAVLRLFLFVISCICLMKLLGLILNLCFVVEQWHL